MRTLVFLAFSMTFTAECANVRADGPDYCESLDMGFANADAHFPAPIRLMLVFFE